MDIDIHGDRTCDLPVISLLQDELLNYSVALPLTKRNLSVKCNNAHSSPAFTMSFPISQIPQEIYGTTQKVEQIVYYTAFVFQFPSYCFVCTFCLKFKVCLFLFVSKADEAVQPWYEGKWRILLTAFSFIPTDQLSRPGR